ncbi:MAG: sugar phosphate isomerase/epimerase family protein [Longimicrobiales bacterium]
MTLPRRDALRRLGLLGACALAGTASPGAALSAVDRRGGAAPATPLSDVGRGGDGAGHESGATGADRRIHRPDRLERIGLHLHALRNLLDDDFEGTLEAVAGIGYREVEFVAYHGRQAEDVHRALVRSGLDAPAAHVSFRTMMSDWEKAIVAAHLIGHRYLVVEAIPSNRRQTLSDYRRAADLFNRAAATARVAGMGFAYHNHAFELEPMEGRVPYDLLLEETDPELVHLEMDPYWIGRGGRDPLEYVERYADRIRLLHVRDPRVDGETTSVGRSTTDFRPILARSREVGIRHYFVGQENSRDALASARASYDHLSGLEF